MIIDKKVSKMTTNEVIGYVRNEDLNAVLEALKLMPNLNVGTDGAYTLAEGHSHTSVIIRQEITDSEEASNRRDWNQRYEDPEEDF